MTQIQPFFRLTALLSRMVVFSVSGLILGITVSGEPAEFVVPSDQRQLFIDEIGVAKIDKLIRTMHQPVKRGAVIRSPDPKKTIQTRTAPVWDPTAKLYKIWVLTIDEKLWQSKDGLHWVPGPKMNMNVRMVVYDVNDPDPSKRYKAALLNKGFAVSPDGVTWRQIDVPKIQSSDEGNFSLDAANGLFLHTVKRSNKYGRAVALATSRDFQTWKDHGVVFGADDRDQEIGKEAIRKRMADETLHRPPYNDPAVHAISVYNMGLFRYEGLYLGLPAFYHATGPVPNYPNTVGFHLVKLVSSRDLKNWDRVGNRATFIGPSRLGSGAYDLTQILPPSEPIVRGDELWFYYTGLKWRGSFTYVGKFPKGEYVPIAGKDRDGGAICLAVLRRDGFVSLDAGEQEGVMETQAFKLAGERVFVNANVRTGQLTVEMLGEDGKLLAVSKKLQGDLPRELVKWRESTADLTGKTIRLRFRLRNGSLYSYWVN